MKMRTAVYLFMLALLCSNAECWAQEDVSLCDSAAVALPPIMDEADTLQTDASTATSVKKPESAKQTKTRKATQQVQNEEVATETGQESKQDSHGIGNLILIAIFVAGIFLLFRLKKGGKRRYYNYTKPKLKKRTRKERKAAIFSWLSKTPEEFIGVAGEKRVSSILSTLPEEYVTLNNVTLRAGYGTTQVDHIVVSTKGIFVIETKTYKGQIRGSEKSENWTQNIYGSVYEFRNPILQNLAHTSVLQNMLSKNGTAPIIPIVVFAGNASIDALQCTSIVVKANELVDVILGHDTIRMTEVQKGQVINLLNTNNVDSEEVRAQHAQFVREKAEMAEAEAESGICPRCGAPLVEHEGAYGKYMSCSNAPGCTYQRKL